MCSFSVSFRQNISSSKNLVSFILAVSPALAYRKCSVILQNDFEWVASLLT